MSEKIKLWRDRAEEIRALATATPMTGEVKDALLKVASGWDQMATSREVMIDLGADLSDEKAG